MREIRTSGLTSGEGRRVRLRLNTAPLLDSTTPQRTGLVAGPAQKVAGVGEERPWTPLAANSRTNGTERLEVSAYRGMLGRSEGDALQVEIGEVVLVAVGAGRGHGDLDAAHAGPDLGADLQELQADGAAGGGGELGVAQADAPQRFHQHVGEGGEPEPELVRPHRRSRRAIGEQVQLLAAPGRPPVVAPGSQASL